MKGAPLSFCQGDISGETINRSSMPTRERERERDKHEKEYRLGRRVPSDGATRDYPTARVYTRLYGRARISYAVSKLVAPRRVG